MNAFLIVCPHCQAKYQVASADVQGKTVTCKKCSQKFAAKVMQAKPKAAPAEPVDDPFGDLISSAASSDTLGSATPLAAMPRKKQSSKSSIPWGLIAIGGGAVVMLAVLAIAAASFLGNRDPVAEAKRLSEADFAAHQKLLKEQYGMTIEIIEAAEAVKQESDMPTLIRKIKSLTSRSRNLAKRAGKIPRLTDKQFDQLNVEVESLMGPLEPRLRAAFKKPGSYQSVELSDALADFLDAGAQFGEEINAAKPRKTAALAETTAAPTSDPASTTSAPASTSAPAPAPIKSPPAEMSAPPAKIISGSVAGDLVKQRELQTEFLTINEEQLELEIAVTSSGDVDRYVTELEKLTQRLLALNERLKATYCLPRPMQDELANEFQSRYADVWDRRESSSVADKLGAQGFKNQRTNSVRGKNGFAREQFTQRLLTGPTRPPGDTSEGPAVNPQMSGNGFPNSPQGMDGRGLGGSPRQTMRERVGPENLVTLEAPTFDVEQIDAIVTRLGEHLAGKGYSSRSGGNMKYAILELNYSGDIEQLAKLIDFAEVEEVNVTERWIRLKSITIAE